ncbi:hypothetical protein KGF56_001628 [Candida oxycetoniae]|uniref:Tubulin-folding cofactor D ARM repeats domain-containing protein n=1 Tax=Candida oxycetoniae TaxID=497107 RepID=A0AAI9T080_9ASCO|nr:uncharacterized protein KGF56_001628 [Candida oxycetoniae]KAI3405610.2 hypothetical protein KGF56_001628 [Candida oxycetoniae]
MDEDLQYVEIYRNNDRLQEEIDKSLRDVGLILNNALLEGDKRILCHGILTRFNNFIEEYEPQPQLLESRLLGYIERLSSFFLQNDIVAESIGSSVYTLARICGFKTVILKFPTNVYLVNTLITKCQNTNIDSAKFVCLLWLCNLVLVPFPLNTIDVVMPQKIYAIGMENLQKYTNCSKVQIVSSMLLSRLLTRADCVSKLDQYIDDVDANWFTTTSNNSKLGHLLVINKILKRTQLKQLQLNNVYNCIIVDILEFNVSNLNVLYMIKILSKLGSTCIQQNNYNMASQIINNLINDILLGDVITFDTNLRYAMAKAITCIITQLSNQAINYQEQLIQFLIKLVDTEMSDDEVNIPKTHTMLLTLGYISLSKKNLQTYEKDCLKIATRFLFFNVKRGTLRLGSQIRDSSCFLIWAIVRNKKTGIEGIRRAFVDLLKVLVFDSELILKKCSLAVIQEILGRFGSELVPIENSELKGEFIVKFIETLGSLHLNQRICYMFIDQFYDKIDLSFLILPLVNIICEENGDGSYLNKLIEQPKDDRVRLVPIQEIELSLIETRLIKAHRWHIFHDIEKLQYCVAELFDKFEMNASNSNLIKGYLIYLKDRKLDDNDWHNLFKILKSDKFVEEFRQVISTQTELPFEEILYHLPYSSVLSHTLFNFKYFDVTEYEKIINLLKSPQVNAYIRANLIENLASNIPAHFKIEKLYDLFDDYTITEQGDVGSRIRMNMIKLVRDNRIMDDQVKLKLARLSGEIMDNLRYAAFETLTGETKFSWKSLFALMEKNADADFEMKVELWRGVVFTAGSSIGNTKEINQSIKELLLYAPKLKDVQILISFLQKPVSRRQMSSRENKCIQVTLQLILKLFQCNYQFPEGINYMEIFIKCYNLHINTRNLTRIKTVLQIFYQLTFKSPSLQSKVYSRFSWIINSCPLNEIRVFLGEVILFHIVNDLNNETIFARYEEIDWFKIDDSVKEFVNDILTMKTGSL